MADVPVGGGVVFWIDATYGAITLDALLIGSRQVREALLSPFRARRQASAT